MPQTFLETLQQEFEKKFPDAGYFCGCREGDLGDYFEGAQEDCKAFLNQSIAQALTNVTAVESEFCSQCHSGRYYHQNDINDTVRSMGFSVTDSGVVSVPKV